MKEFVNTAWKDIGYQVYEYTVFGRLWKPETWDYSIRGNFLGSQTKTAYNSYVYKIVAGA